MEIALDNIGKRSKIVQAVHGGKSSGRDFCNHLRSCMTHLGFLSCKADPEVCIQDATKCDGTPYYQCALLHVDDVSVVVEEPEQMI